MTSAPALLLSIIVCTRNRARSLERALESLVAQDPPPGEWEIVVVDNGSTDDTAAVIRSFSGRAPVHYTYGSTPGLGGARNSGIAAARGSLLAFTDDDVVVQRDWATRICNRFSRDPAVAAVYGFTDGDSGQSMFSMRTRPGACYLEGKEDVWESSPGNNMAYRRDVFNRIGVFDPSFGPGAKYQMADDAEFSYRFFKAGMRAFYDPEIKVWHAPHVDSRPFQSEILRSDVGIAAWYGKHAVHGDLFAIRLFLVHLGRNIMGVRSLMRAIGQADGGELQFRARRLRVLVQAFCSRALMELRQ